MAALSGQLVAKPDTTDWPKENMWSPTQAMGRYATTSSSGPSPSKATALRAVTIRFSCVSTVPLGWPVVPDV